MGAGRLDVQRLSVQGEMRRLGNDASSEYRLKLNSGFKPLHFRPTSAQEQQVKKISREFLEPSDGKTLAAFGTTGCNDCAATACFHAREKTVCTGALDFGRLVCAFHDKSYGALTGLLLGCQL